MRNHRSRIAGSLLCLLACQGTFAAGRPRLQIINGSSQPIDIFWLKTDAERVASGSVAVGKETTITTTLGHRFVVVGREDKAEATVTSTVPVQGYRFDPRGKDGVPSFYTQRISANGFPIVASARVHPFALKEAAYLVNLMLAQRPDVREAMIQSGARLCIMAHDEFTTDLPEFVRLGAEPVPGFEGIAAKDYWDARARGLGGSESDPLCSCAEENLLGYPGDPYEKESVLIHELAHNIHLRGLINVDPTFDQRLREAHGAAMKAGLWKGKYASVNHHEYFAEGVQSWFDNNRVNDHDHNHVNTRALLLEYDSGLAALCREVFGDTVLKYTKPVTRLTDHLQGYDPAAAPKFVWPERLQQAKTQIRAQAEARSQRASADAATIRGKVADAAGKAMQGVMVSAFDEERHQSITVMSQADGSFTLEGLREATYNVRARLLGQLDEWHNEVKVGASDLAFVLEPAQGNELEMQRPGSSGFGMLKWDNKRDKENFKLMCAYCHQPGTVGFRTPEQPVDWETMITRMDGFGGLYPHTQKTLVKRLVETYSDEAVAKWPPFVPPPAPTGVSLRARITEWDMGTQFKAMVHDLEPGPDGLMYAVDMGDNAVLTLDPATGKRETYPLPGRYRGPHSIELANDGNMWITLCISGEMAKFDVKTKQFTITSSAEAPAKRGSYPHTLRINPRDPEGLI